MLCSGCCAGPGAREDPEEGLAISGIVGEMHVSLLLISQRCVLRIRIGKLVHSEEGENSSG